MGHSEFVPETTAILEAPATDGEFATSSQTEDRQELWLPPSGSRPQFECARRRRYVIWPLISDFGVNQSDDMLTSNVHHVIHVLDRQWARRL